MTFKRYSFMLFCLKFIFLVVLMQKKSQPSALQNNNIFKHEKHVNTHYIQLATKSVSTLKKKKVYKT